ncbi:hypothetical protein FAM21731_02143 [Lentilactobacillus parabuchneri]|nr:hypothetical protein FAM21731_02143 [Lentilactobacillus parabuchneri]
MRKYKDIIIAYISIVLLLLAPLYYLLERFSLFIQLHPDSIELLIFSVILDIILVRKTFKIYYD